MREIERSIIPFIESQFPSFYKEEGEDFIAFVKAYYEWMEQEGNVLFHSRQFYDYIDVDTTISEFLTNFKSKYLNNFPTSNLLLQPIDIPTSVPVVPDTTPTLTPANTLSKPTSSIESDAAKRVLTKKAVDLYRAKGNENALNLLFRLLYREPVKIHLPSTDILKPSDGRWIVAKYLELSITDKNKQMVGKTVTGLTSGATAVVEKISRRMISGNIFDVAYLTNVKGNFLFGEIVTHDGLAVGSPTTLGSVTSVIIDNQGKDFEVGQYVDLVSSMSGRLAKARVTKVGTQTGKITYSNPPEDGGFGYTIDAQVFISSNVLFTDNRTLRDPGYRNFAQFETITQPMANVPFTAATREFANGMFVYGIDASTSPANTTIAAGYILKFSQNTSNEGWLLISPRTVSNVSITNIQNAANTGSFAFGEKVYQINPLTNANSAVGSVVGATSSRVQIDVVSGTFVINREIKGSTSNCVANAISIETYNKPFTNGDITHIIEPAYATVAIRNAAAVDKTASGKVVGANNNAVGIYDVDAANPFVNAFSNYIISSKSNIIANVGLISSGDPGGFEIASLTDTETIFISTDFISDNNIFDEAYLTLNLNADDFGFPKYPSGNISTVLDVCFSRDTLEIGTIASLTNIDPGSNNTAIPFIRVYEKNIALHDRRNFTLMLSNVSKPFVIGEPIVQSFPDGAMTLSLTSVSGSFNASGREIISQVRSDGITTYGELVEKDITGTTGSIRVRVANTSNTFDTSNTITGINSSATATVTTVTQNNYFSIAKGIVLSSNTTSMNVKRKTFGASFSRNIPISGAVSGATADVGAVYQIPDSPVIGNNAVIGAFAGVQTGTLQEVEVSDSGIGYYDLEPVKIVYPGNPTIATGYVVMGNEGETGGFYRDTGGFISTDKKIQDSNYYQEFSYEIQSSLSLDKYATILRETLQVAGTKLFGRVIKASNAVMTITTTPIARVASLNFTPDILPGNTPGFSISEVVVNQTNTAQGVVADYTTQLTLDGSNNEFVVGRSIAQPSFSLNRANGIIKSVEYNVAANTTSIRIANVEGFFTSSSNVSVQFDRKFVEYTAVSGEFTNGEIVYQSNGTANVGVGDLISSSAQRLRIKPLTDLLISNKQGALTDGSSVYQRADGITNNAVGTIFSSNSTHILIGNIQGQFLPGIQLHTSSGNASVVKYGGKTEEFTVTDKVFLNIDDLSSAGFTNGEVVIQANTAATGTVTFANTTQLTVETVTGTFVTNEIITGNTSNTTANVVSVAGPFPIVGVTSGAIANAISLESPFTNVSLSVISTINTIRLSNVSGTFVINTTIRGATSNATANVTSVGVLLE